MPISAFTIMRVFAVVMACCLTLIVLWEIFETIVLPRRIDRKLRITRYYYLVGWRIFGWMCERISQPKRRGAALAIFGPLSLLGLFAVWGASLIFAFALMNWTFRPGYKLPDGEALTFTVALYASRTTLTTLGLGDVTPR